MGTLQSAKKDFVLSFDVAEFGWIIWCSMAFSAWVTWHEFGRPEYNLKEIWNHQLIWQGMVHTHMVFVQTADERGGPAAANSFWNHDRVDQITIFLDGEWAPRRGGGNGRGKSVKIMLITRCEPRQWQMLSRALLTEGSKSLEHVEVTFQK